MVKIRLLVTIFGAAIAVLGVWYLIFLVTMVRTYGSYPNGEHLYGGGLFIAGGLIMIFGNFLCDWYKSYQEKKDDIKLSSNYFK